jgi:uncharacterized membrane-anchored protein YhcB (DUF1043 family)
MILGILIGGAVGFVAGILVGRKNKQGVEKLLEQAKAELAKVKGGK